MGPRVISYGGGVQSTALLVLAARGEINYHIALFANTGDDSENPKTLEYVRTIAADYCRAQGIQFEELQRQTRAGHTETLYEHLTRPESRSLSIPVRTGGKPMNRKCTVNFKIKVILRWLRAHGASKHDPATSALGISLDEFQRARSSSNIPYQHITYPLLDLRLTRYDCTRIIEREGLPVPPKSSCYFCPFHRLSEWQQLRHESPELFERSADLEAILNARSRKLGHRGVWFTNKLVPLRDATSEHLQLPLAESDDNCESGYCFT